MNSNFTRMAARMGFSWPAKDSEIGANQERNRLFGQGGLNQQDRMIYDKRRSFDRALKYSYQAANIKKLPCEDELDNSNLENIYALDTHEICRGLINSDKLKQNYDDKILSVHYEENFHNGDIFEWIGTNTYWICYLQDLTELAYFRSEIRRCDYQLKWQDEDGIHQTYAAIRGPVETKINYIQKHTISIDTPNYSLNILMPLTESAKKYFQRYSKFYLTNSSGEAEDVCWRVEAIDWISTPGILEIGATEYYKNDTEDSDGLSGNLKTIPVNPNDYNIEMVIQGETFIKPKITYTYISSNDGSWNYDKNLPIVATINSENNSINIKWDSSYSGQFDLTCGDITKTIVVESLF